MKSIGRMVALALWVLLVSGVAHVACGKGDGKEGEEAKETPVAGGPGQIAIGGASGAMTTTAGNIDTVYQDFQPGSLAVSTSHTLVPQDDLSGDPCVGTSGIFGCQPNLLRRYIAMARLSLYMTKQQVSMVATQMSGVPIPASGERRGSQGQMGAQLNFKSATDYKVVARTSASGSWNFLLSVNGSVTEILADDSVGKGKFYSKLTYVSESDWSIETGSYDRACDTLSTRAPQVIVLRIKRAQGLWKGKAMMYSPRWLGDLGCSVTPTSANAMHIFTDFVGDDTNSSAALHMLGASVSDRSQFSSWNGSSFCSNFPSHCSGGTGVGETSQISGFTNPFCVAAGVANASWGAFCSSSSSDIATGAYSDISEWLLPSEVSSYTQNMPTTILE